MVKLYAKEPTTEWTPICPPLMVTKLDPRARLPELYDPSSIGLDVFAFLLTESGRATSRAISTKGVTEVPTGIKVHPPAGYCVQITSRLSLARKGIFVPNAPALIPTGFDSELTILLFNGSHETQYVAHDHRIAQLTLQPIIYPAVRESTVPAPKHSEDVHPEPGKGDN